MILLFSAFFVIADNGTDVIIDEDVILDEGSRSYCGGEVACHCGDTIIEDYVMTEDLNCPGYNWGLTFAGSNIILDCDGYTIMGGDGHDTYGIYLHSSPTDNTVTNCHIRDWMHGIMINSNTHDHLIDGNHIEYNLYGLSISGYSTDMEIVNNQFNDENRGVWLSATSNNLIHQNRFVGTSAYEELGAQSNAWNLELGNYWSDFEANQGFPDQYIIPGPGNGIDYNPWWDQDEDDINYDDDNCPFTYNPEQEDYDSDGVGDVCDNCYRMSNPEQENSDDDIYGDVCDNCAYTTNPSQSDFDEDRIGDWCDNCIMTWNHYQLDDDENGVGNSCEGRRYQCYDAHSIDPGNTGVTP